MSSSRFASPFMAKSPFYQEDKPSRGSTTGNKIRLKGDYKEGTLASEDDLDEALGMPTGEQTGVSGQDYSSVRVDAQGPYVVKLKDIDNEIDEGDF